MNESGPADEWEQSWRDRTATLESIFGPMEPDVGHSPVPFDLGPEAGGDADVTYFAGILRTGHLPADGQAWGPGIISRLAHYTLEVALDPCETMSIGSVVSVRRTVVNPK